MLAAACSSGATAAPSTAGGASPSAAATAAAQSAAATAAGGTIGGSVSIVAVWSGGTDPKSEEFAFRSVLKPFTDATGVSINYTSTRDINAVLTTGVASGNLPDVAGLPGPGKVIELANQGVLKPLEDTIDVPAYGRRHPRCRRAAGQRQAVRRVLQGLDQGPDLVRPQGLQGRRADKLG